MHTNARCERQTEKLMASKVWHLSILPICELTIARFIQMELFEIILPNAHFICAREIMRNLKLWSLFPFCFHIFISVSWFSNHSERRWGEMTCKYLRAQCMTSFVFVFVFNVYLVHFGFVGFFYCCWFHYGCANEDNNGNKVLAQWCLCLSAPAFFFCICSVYVFVSVNGWHQCLFTRILYALQQW